MDSMFISISSILVAVFAVFVIHRFYKIAFSFNSTESEDLRNTNLFFFFLGGVFSLLSFTIIAHFYNLIKPLI